MIQYRQDAKNWGKEGLAVAQDLLGLLRGSERRDQYQLSYTSAINLLAFPATGIDATF